MLGLALWESVARGYDGVHVDAIETASFVHPEFYIGDRLANAQGFWHAVGIDRDTLAWRGALRVAAWHSLIRLAIGLVPARWMFRGEAATFRRLLLLSSWSYLVTAVALLVGRSYLTAGGNVCTAGLLLFMGNMTGTRQRFSKALAVMGLGSIGLAASGQGWVHLPSLARVGVLMSWAIGGVCGLAWALCISRPIRRGGRVAAGATAVFAVGMLAGNAGEGYYALMAHNLAAASAGFVPALGLVPIVLVAAISAAWSGRPGWHLSAGD